MRTRDATILIATFLLASATGLVWWNQESQAVELPPGVTNSHSPAAEPAVLHRDEPVVALATPNEPLAPAVAVSEAAVRRVDTDGWTKGIVRGDIQLAVSVLDRLESITVEVAEARSFTRGGGPRPHRLLVNVKRGLGTPTFEVTGVPFSEYPYVVSVYAPGLNGSRRTVTIDKEHPLVDDIVLAITPGSPFSILVRDQDASPYTGIDVFMRAVGEPAGRPPHKGVTDNFGSLVFDDVLAGDYEVQVSLGGQALIDPRTISVQPGFVTFGPKVQGQSLPLTIPRGIPLQLLVHDGAGYPLPDSRVTAINLDRIKLTSPETTTDFGGRAHFHHLPAGRWQIIVERDLFRRHDQAVTLKSGQEAAYLDVKLVPVRR